MRSRGRLGIHGQTAVDDDKQKAKKKKFEEDIHKKKVADSQWPRPASIYA
jgi:hypothetical protein